MASYSDKPMSFSFKKPEGAKSAPMAEGAEESAEAAPMSTDEMGAAVKAAMSTGGSALYEAISRIVDHCKG
jgi:hypothetical protein